MTSTKITIQDPTIRIKPSERLCNFIISLSDLKEMPENVLKIYQVYGGEGVAAKKPVDRLVQKPNFTKDDMELLKKLNKNEIGQDTVVDLKELINSELSDDSDDDGDDDDVETVESTKGLSKTQARKLKEKQKQRIKSKLTLNLNDLKWLNELLVQRRKENDECQDFLYEMLQESKLILPKNEYRERDPVLEARCVRLRLEQDARMYNAMTKNVDSSRKHVPEDTIAYQMNQINRQLIAVLQFVFSVAAGFAFGFIGVELMIGGLDFGFRLLLGIICSLIIALAEIYFLAKKLNEEYDMSVEQIKLKATTKSSDMDNDEHSMVEPLLPPLRRAKTKINKDHND